MWPKSLNHTLLLIVTVLVIGSGILISSLVTHRYGAALLEGAAAQADNIAHKLALDAADKILINDLVAVQKLLDDQIYSNPAVAYLFVMKDGRILAHTFASGIPLELIDANQPQDSDKGHLNKIISEDGERFLDIAWPVFSGKAGTLRLGFSEKPYRQRVTRLWFQMMSMTLAILMVALIVSYLFIMRLTRPLQTLSQAAEKIDAGNLETHVNVRGRAEVSKLAASFNGMLQRLRDYTQRLETSKQKLEEKNLELDRAHRQLRTSFDISQEIAGLANLKDVCTYLIHSFKNIVECRQMALLLFSSNGDEGFLFSENSQLALDQNALNAAQAAVKELRTVSFISNERLRSFPLPDDLKIGQRLATLPFKHHGELLGVMLISCPGDCRCVTKELDILNLILKQTSGTIKRASLHEEEIRNLQARIESNAGFSGFVGKDPKMQLVYKLIEDVAPTDATVLIQGESGTGKELVARAIQERSPRRKKPFVVINCSAYPSTLLESELFGHEKGSFTGALRLKSGRFEQADGGTVFLDEIGEISPSAQIKLLRVLQSQKFERLGGEQTLSVDIRILAATNKNLLTEIRRGNFREDLFYRLNVIPISLPPLRERRNDIPLLADHFLREFTAKQSKNELKFSSEAMRLLMKYDWPGNVRELENSIEHAVVLAKGKMIEPPDLPLTLVDPHRTALPSSLVPESPKTILETEEKLVRAVLEECNWNKTAAATRLGISRSTLYEKLKKYAILPPTLH